MKTSLSLTLAAALAAFSTVNAAPEKSKDAVFAFNANRAPALMTSPDLRRGMRSAEALLTLGEPDLRLGAGVWVYWNFETNRDDVNARGLNSLVLAITDGAISEMKIVSRQTLEPYIARLTPTTKPVRVIAAK